LLQTCQMLQLMLFVPFLQIIGRFSQIVHTFAANLSDASARSFTPLLQISQTLQPDRSYLCRKLVGRFRVRLQLAQSVTGLPLVLCNLDLEGSVCACVSSVCVSVCVCAV
jgi:hypothetical protein